MYQLKQIPEDFIVTEVSSIVPQTQGKYIYFILKKKNRNTLDAIKQIARVLSLREKDIGFAGSKDKQAITQQVCSVSGVGKDRLLAVKLDGITLEFFGYGAEPISLGDLQGNKFKITVRNLDAVTVKPIQYVENYFDEQRFSNNNTAIGKNIVQKKFKEAAGLVDDPCCQDYLAEHPRDYVGALKQIPLRMLRLYVNAFQSYLWNETLSAYLRKNEKVLGEIEYSLGKLVFVEDLDSVADLEVPILGFGSEDLKLNIQLQEIVNTLLQKEGIDYSDFIIKQIPELSLEGETRKAVVVVEGFVASKEEEDELNVGKKKVKVVFTLPKGSYATMVMKRLFG